MLDETDAFVAEAKRQQRDRYRQLLFVLASLGVIALGIGVALYLLVPRRLGQLYEAEQRSRQEAESRAEAARALAHVSDGVILTDSEGRVRFWNPGAEKLTGLEEDGAIGRELSRLLPGGNGSRGSRRHSPGSAEPRCSRSSSTESGGSR